MFVVWLVVFFLISPYQYQAGRKAATQSVLP